LALIDELLKQVESDPLRNVLGVEIARLRERKTFGLVFEKHIPEIAVVTSAPLRTGMLARRRDRPDEHVDYEIEALSARTATVRAVKDDAEPEKVPRKLLAAVKEFGQPVYPGLKHRGSARRSDNRPSHVLIKGENFHALQMLEIFGDHSVDCIYIDPPYNTGGTRDWKYNNAYVDSKDHWRHSKWLSMMEKRLLIARRLLKEDGVLVVMIDEHEFHHLGMLLDQVFPDYLQYAVSIVINSRGSTGNRNFGVIEERAIFVVPDLGYDLIEARERFIQDIAVPDNEAEDDGSVILEKLFTAFPELADRAFENGHLDADEREFLEDLLLDAEDGETVPTGDGDGTEGEYWRGAVRTGQGTSFRTQRKRQFYPIYINPKTHEFARVGEPLLETDSDGNLVSPSWKAEKNGVVPVWPIDEEGRERVWCFEPGRMRGEIEAGNLAIGKYNPKRKTYAINVRRVRRTKTRFREITIWWHKSYDAGSNGTNVLKKFLGESGTFPFPKSIYAVRDVLATVVGNRPDAVILDFFAGSATTFHATCLLNALDEGRRRTILVTNNEVDATTAEALAAEGVYPGDPEYERRGIFEHVAMPRVRAVVEGRRPDGTPVPGRHKWAGGRPFADGFEENVEFFELTYLDPDEVELGLAFSELHPLLWLTAGARTKFDSSRKPKRYLIEEEAGYAVIDDDAKLRAFERSLADHESVDNIFHITNATEAFAELVALIDPERRTFMLHRDYLAACRSSAKIDA
jgi:adenine-specific DNA-methyltransferase